MSIRRGRHKRDIQKRARHTLTEPAFYFREEQKLSGVIKLNINILAVFGVDLPQGTLGKVKDAGNDDIGELLDADIVDIDRLVEELATIGDLVFEFSDPVAQLLEGFVRFQLRVTFDHHKE